MNEIVTIPTYHYVRPIAASRFPAIRGLEVTDFEGQLDYIERHYRVVSAAEVATSARGGRPLPERPLLLTFDDGYVDHHRYVFPILRRRGLSGVFFPSSGAVTERRMLDVNKIHFLLASTGDHAGVMARIEQFVELHRAGHGLRALADYRSAFFYDSDPYDSAEVLYIKRMLQHALPEELRRQLLDELFRGYVSADEAAFADDLYLTESQLREMIAGGMEVGGHGHAHHWLNSLPRDEQSADIDRSLELLTRLGLPTQEFLFCYPYGGYNADTLALLRMRGCVAAFTTNLGLASVDSDHILELRRIDTNDLPLSGDAREASWTQQAAGAVPAYQAEGRLS